MGQQSLIPPTPPFKDPSQAMSSFVWSTKHVSPIPSFLLNALGVLYFLTTQAKTFTQMVPH